jgi:hypothetical protein
MTFTIPRPDWVSDDLVAERGEHAGFQMYTTEGNDAVAEMVITNLTAAEKSDLPRRVIIAMLKIGVAEVARVHPEVYDTEPRGAILDVLDKFLHEQGFIITIDGEVF